MALGIKFPPINAVKKYFVAKPAYLEQEFDLVRSLYFLINSCSFLSGEDRAELKATLALDTKVVDLETKFDEIKAAELEYLTEAIEDIRSLLSKQGERANVDLADIAASLEQRLLALKAISKYSEIAQVPVALNYHEL